MDIKVLEKLSWIETGYLDAAFNEINNKYGSMDRYIQEVLGISENKRQEYIKSLHIDNSALFSSIKSIKIYNNFNAKKPNFFSNFAFLIHLFRNENKVLGTY
jgi:hypothetical protein